ncbi:murein hydrolase regulator LrgA [Salipaludibacillus neizhouensis]|uniref:Murein hydrolase regulator LrgA n=1 Tax=Salipaludibacillus neizhouensis TaxID=885475 RepID=A0A3A9K798_9BACI|nr:CidA/LrgA family protein [Salipaludibacillus neizhouensis]RKL65523.1 murein hydrolase regulator LrgA [Salipaludibacillus neizhouensis]
MRNAVIFLLQVLFLIAIFSASNFIVKYTNLFIPGNVLGMILLFVSLTLGIVKLNYIEKAAEYLIKHLALFFIPYAVGIMTYGDLIKTSGWKLLVMIVGSTIIGLIITSGMTQYLSSKEKQKHVQSDSQ